MTDAILFRLTVADERLTPATAFDQERLVTQFKPGDEVECVIRGVRNTKNIRKLYMVVGLAVKQLATPWDSADDAIAALKDRLGLFRHVPGFGPERLKIHRSLNEIGNAELEDFMEGCWLLLQKLTGTDPLTLVKETGDTAAPAQADSRPDVVEGDAVRRADDESVQSLSRPHHPADDAHASGELNVSPSDDNFPAIRADMLTRLFRLADDSALMPAERIAAMESTRNAWAEQLGPARQGVLQQTFDTMKKVIKGELPADAARRFLSSLE